MSRTSQVLNISDNHFLESVADKCPKTELWIVVSRVSILKLTDLVNFPAKKLDGGRFCI